MILRFLIPIFFLFQCGYLRGAEELGPKPNGYTVYLFLGEECIISQQYTVLIKRLYQEYASEYLAFKGLFPNPSSSLEKIAQFNEKYELPFELAIDHLQRKMEFFEVQVTPEVVVFDEKKKVVIYQGRLDNTFVRVGKRRTITTTSELEDVLKELKNGRSVPFYKTVAVGCYITPLDQLMKNVKMCKPEITGN
jgi:hypothetical protein